MGGGPRRRGWYRVEVEADQTEASRAIQNAAGDVQGTADCRILSCIECRSEKPFTGIIGSARKEMGRPDGEESTAAGMIHEMQLRKDPGWRTMAAPPPPRHARATPENVVCTRTLES